ncbi:MAG: LON peptidase substrate-binding domain-containing protein [Deltaproteobacteria bacterium]
MAELPTQIALFPLPNVVLFPRVSLPLHIFEPRYRAMVADVRATDGWIGMVLLHPRGVAGPGGGPPILPIGCAGQIRRFDLLKDGRSNLMLEGMRRFRVEEEDAERVYRRARVAWLGSEEAEHSLAVLPAGLLEEVEVLLRREGRGFKGKLIDHLPADLALLVNTLSFALDFAMVEKVALLECESVAARAERLGELVRFRLAAGKAPDTLQ